MYISRAIKANYLRRHSEISIYDYIKLTPVRGHELRNLIYGRVRSPSAHISDYHDYLWNLFWRRVYGTRKLVTFDFKPDRHPFMPRLPPREG